MIRMYWVEDFMSGAVIDNRHYTEKQLAVDRRNEIGYGIVKRFDFQDGDEVAVDVGCPVAAKCNGCGQLRPSSSD